MVKINQNDPSTQLVYDPTELGGNSKKNNFGSHRISKVSNQGQDCFIIATLHELAHINVFQPMLEKNLTKKADETDEFFRARQNLQTRLKKVVTTIKEGNDVSKKEMNEIRESLISINFLPKLNLIQKLLSRIFPSIFSYQSGDLFQLYNAIRNTLEEKDLFIPSSSYSTSSFFKKVESKSSLKSNIIHLFPQKKEDYDFDDSLKKQAIETNEKLNLKINCKKTDISEVITITSEEKSKKLHLKLIQCTAPNKFFGIETSSFHSFVFLKKDDSWYLCNDSIVKPIPFEEITKIAKKGILHLHYES